MANKRLCCEQSTESTPWASTRASTVKSTRGRDAGLCPRLGPNFHPHRTPASNGACPSQPASPHPLCLLRPSLTAGPSVGSVPFLSALLHRLRPAAWPQTPSLPFSLPVLEFGSSCPQALLRSPVCCIRHRVPNKAKLTAAVETSTIQSHVPPFVLHIRPTELCCSLRPSLRSCSICSIQLKCLPHVPTVRNLPIRQDFLRCHLLH